MFDLAPRLYLYIPTSGPRAPGFRAGLIRSMTGQPALGSNCWTGGRKCGPAFRVGLIGLQAGNLHREGGLRAGVLGPPTAARPRRPVLYFHYLAGLPAQSPRVLVAELCRGPKSGA